MNKLEELNKDLEFRRMCRYSDDWLEGYRTARLEEINVVESALAEQPQVNKEQVRWLLEKHTEHHWSKAATINIAALTKGFNALLSAPATPGPVSTVPGGTLGYETTSYGAKYLEPAPAVPEVDWVEKWQIRWDRILGTQDFTKETYDCQDGFKEGRRLTYGICRDELAAWLPAHDVKVREKALEEAANHIEATHTLDYMLVLRNELQMEIRALAKKEQ